MARPTYFHDLMLKLWPLSKVAFRMGKTPIIGPLIRPFFSRQGHEATIIPVNEEIRVSGSTPLPASILRPLVEQATSRFIMDECMCRKSEGCRQHPTSLGCLYLGDSAARINPALGHAATVDETLAHIERAMQAGLSPLVAHTVFDAYLLGVPYRRLLTVCFCCDCCCAIRHGLRMGPKAFWDVVVKLPGLTVSVGDDCIGCETCAAVCPVRAISFGAGQARIGEECKGCGLCAETCPMGAINLRLVEGVDVYGSLLQRIQSRTVIS